MFAFLFFFRGFQGFCFILCLVGWCGVGGYGLVLGGRGVGPDFDFCGVFGWVYIAIFKAREVGLKRVVF